MDKKTEKTFQVLIDEFKLIKDTFNPLLKEFEHMKKMEVEFKRFKEETISKLKRQEEALKRKEIKSSAGSIESNTNKEKVSALMAQNFEFKKELKESITYLMGVKKEMKEYEKWIKKRDTNQTKEMNTRKRHINQIVNELNASRKIVHQNSIKNTATKKTLREMNSTLSKIGSDLETLKRSNKTKVVKKDLDDFKLNFARLEKKTISEVGEIKGRMRELERKTLEKRDIDKLQTSVDEMQTKQINKIKDEIVTVGSKIKSMSKAVEKKDSIVERRIMSRIEKMSSSLNENEIKRLSEMENTIKTNKQKTDEMDLKLRGDLQNLSKTLDGINIKVENTSKLLRDLEKVL